DRAVFGAAGAVHQRRRRRAAASTTAAAAAATTNFVLHADGAAVLLRAAHVIRNVDGRRRVVELRRGKVLRRPALAARRPYRAAAVVADDHVRRVVGVEPEIVEVAVRLAAERTDGLAAVRGLERRDVQHVD